MLTTEQRNYDAWVTREPPWADWPDPWELLPRCEACGCWLPHKPDREEELVDGGHCEGPREDLYGPPVAGWIYTPCETDCKGPHDYVHGVLIREFRDCRHCGATNVQEMV